MGWTYGPRERGTKALDYWRGEMGEGVLDCATVNFKETYIAYRMKTGAVIGIAILTDWRRDPMFNFGYKDMSEDMGPCIARCPARILDQLSSLEEIGLTPSADGDGSYEWAKDWRKRCRATIAARASRPALREGLTIRLTEPVTFSNGVSGDTFVVADARRRLFRASPNGYSLVRIRATTLDGATVVS